MRLAPPQAPWSAFIDETRYARGRRRYSRPVLGRKRSRICVGSRALAGVSHLVHKLLFRRERLGRKVRNSALIAL
jgi:hypothetical protein